MYPDIPTPYGTITIYPLGCNLRCGFCSVPYFSRPDETRIEPYSFWRSCFHSSGSLAALEENADLPQYGLPLREITIIGGEPTIHVEFIEDVADICKSHNLRLSMSTNCFTTPETMKKLVSLVDYFHLGVKGSLSPRLYRELDADPQVIMNNIEIVAKSGQGFIIANLVDPSLEDTEQDARNLGNWIKEKISAATPVWIIRRMALFTDDVVSGRKLAECVGDPSETLIHIRDVAKAIHDCGLKNVGYESDLGEAGLLGGRSHHESIQSG